MMLGGGGISRRAYKTKLCVLWQRGRCSRPSCNFAHGDADLRRFSHSSHSSFRPPPPPPPPAAAAAHGAQGYGRREYRSGDLRDKLDRRYSPRRRYSPGRDTRGHHSLHDPRPSSRERGSSISRSPIRKSERRHRKKQLTDEESNSSGSLKMSRSNEDRKKEDKFSADDEKDGLEEQLKQIELDIEALRDDKSQLEILLDEKVDEAHKLSSRIDDLESQLSREQEECRRMTSKLKKFLKAHVRCMKAQEELKRSQARFQKIADLLSSDILKPGANEEGSSVNVADDEDPNGSHEMSPSDQWQNHVSATRKRSIPHSTTSEEAKTGKRKRERYSDVIPKSEKYRLEGVVLEFDNNSKGTETMKSFPVKNKKLAEDDKHKQGNFVSSSYVFSDKVKGYEVRHVLPSTSMAAHAVDEFGEAIEMEDKPEPTDAATCLENGAVDNKTKSSHMPPPPPPVVQNAYKQYEGDDEEVDVEKVDAEMVDIDSIDEVEIEQ